MRREDEESVEEGRGRTSGNQERERERERMEGKGVFLLSTLSIPMFHSTLLAAAATP